MPGTTPASGFFTVNTPGTKAAVGFHSGKPLACGEVTITPAAQFAAIFLTALEPDKTLADCRSALVTAIARQANKDFSYFLDKSVVAKGQAPDDARASAGHDHSCPAAGSPRCRC